MRHWTSVILNGSLGGDFLMDYTAMRCQGHWKMVRYLFAYYVAVMIVHFSWGECLYLSIRVLWFVLRREFLWKWRDFHSGWCSLVTALASSGWDQMYCDHQENEVVVLTTCYVETGCFNNCCIRVKKTKSQVEKPHKRTQMAFWTKNIKHKSVQNMTWSTKLRLDVFLNKIYAQYMLSTFDGISYYTMYHTS